MASGNDNQNCGQNKPPYINAGRVIEGGKMVTAKKDFIAHLTGSDGYMTGTSFRHCSNDVDMSEIINSFPGDTIQQTLELLSSTVDNQDSFLNGINSRFTAVDGYFAATASSILLLASTDVSLQSQITINRTNIQVFTSSGTWFKPTGIPSTTPVVAYIFGGGGGGGSGLASFARAGGGGGSSYPRIFRCLAGFLSSTITVTVGAGGLGGPIAFNATPGGHSSFGISPSARSAGGINGLSGSFSSGGNGGNGGGSGGNNTTPGTGGSADGSAEYFFGKAGNITAINTGADGGGWYTNHGGLGGLGNISGTGAGGGGGGGGNVTIIGTVAFPVAVNGSNAPNSNGGRGGEGYGAGGGGGAGNSGGAAGGDGASGFVLVITG